MSKSMVKKFRKNDYSEENVQEDNRFSFNKHVEKRVERALKTKDISALVEDDYDDFEDEDNWYRVGR